MTRTRASTPAADGFRMPAEFEPHRRCWMLWPERPDNWRAAARPAQLAFAQVAAAIGPFEPVTVGASAAHYTTARALLPETVRVVEMSHDDCWMRDVGPTCVVNTRGGVRGVDWRFNAWGGLEGGLYFPWDQDDLVAAKVLEVEDLERYRAPFVNEGGAIHVDGQGTALVTEECLLNPNRNPGSGRAAVDSRLRAYLGVSQVIWLGRGVVDDETSGHVDNLACFVRPGVVCLTWTDRRRDPQYAISRDAWERLHDARDAQGRRLRVARLPMPGPLTLQRREAAGVVPREHGARFTRDRKGDVAIVAHLRVVANSFEPAIRDPWRSSRAEGDLVRGRRVDLDLEDARRSAHDLFERVGLEEIQVIDRTESIAERRG